MTATIPRSVASEKQRDQLVRGLVGLASWLLDHPEAPVHPSGAMLQYGPGTAEGVREIAAELGIKAEEKPGVVHAAVKFGPVQYVLYAQKPGSTP
jgi:hypothetical protein